jgi:Asp-tRNA(Asn)/Glu-tRNA(Gln) amidotransferase A subunit family amidase
VQDCFLVEGHFSTLGLAAYLVHGRDEINSPLVEILLKEGAIIIMKTNVAQTLMVGRTRLDPVHS